MKSVGYAYVQFLTILEQYTKSYETKIIVEMNQLVGSTTSYERLRNDFATSFIHLVDRSFLYRALVGIIFSSDNAFKAYLFLIFDNQFSHYYNKLGSEASNTVGLNDVKSKPPTNL